HEIRPLSDAKTRLYSVKSPVTGQTQYFCTETCYQKYQSYMKDRRPLKRRTMYNNMRCPRCCGHRQIPVGGFYDDPEMEACDLCNGAGRLCDSDSDSD